MLSIRRGNKDFDRRFQIVPSNIFDRNFNKILDIGTHPGAHFWQTEEGEKVAHNGHDQEISAKIPIISQELSTSSRMKWRVLEPPMQPNFLLYSVLRGKNARTHSQISS